MKYQNMKNTNLQNTNSLSITNEFSKCSFADEDSITDKPNMVKSIIGNHTNIIPIWFMRQAGRYLPEYRFIRKKFHSFVDLCLDSNTAAEISLQPLKRFDLNGAIIFSDILIIAHALGAKVSFIENIGPKILVERPLQKNHDIYFKTIEMVAQTVKKVRANIPSDKAVIGFAGSPWTVASYIIEQGTSKDFSKAKAEAFSGNLDSLIELLTDSTIEYLSQQIEAGADIVKLFDSWAGVLSSTLFDKYVIKPTQIIVKTLKDKYPTVPIIGFPKGVGMNYKKYAIMTGIDCLALDSSISMEWASQEIQNQGNIAIQGNLDNSLLLCTNLEIVKTETLNILNNVNVKTKFIFNLGHGVLKESRIENISTIIETIRLYERTFCTI